MAVRCIDDDQIAFRIYQSFCPLQSLVTHRRRCSHAQTAGGILRGLRISYCLFNILDRDEADAMIMPIDNQQLFDAPLMQQAACILLTDRSEAQTSELQSLMRLSYAVFCLKK